jgi:tetratricopeptide (TPR) repeat protein
MPGVAEGLRGRIAEARRHLERAESTSRADERWNDVAQASLDLARVERTAGTGREGAVLQEMLDRGEFANAPGPIRPYGQIVGALAFAGMGEDALRLLDEWAAVGGPTASGPFYEETREMVEAAVLGLSDPGAGADALLALRTRLDCPRCWTWRIGDLLTEAGRVDEAITQRLASLETGEDFWFGMHRLMAREKLGQLYEAKGDNARAAEHYRIFAEQWADADAEFQPRVREAREKSQVTGG